jgi:hypothetical protein
MGNLGVNPKKCQKHGIFTLNSLFNGGRANIRDSFLSLFSLQQFSQGAQ